MASSKNAFVTEESGHHRNTSGAYMAYDADQVATEYDGRPVEGQLLYKEDIDSTGDSFPMKDGTAAQPTGSQMGRTFQQRMGRFRVSGYRDVWAAIAFILVLVMSVVWAIVNYSTHTSVPSASDGGNEAPFSGRDLGKDLLTKSFLLMTVCVLVSSVGTSFLATALLARYSYIMIIVANVAVSVQLLLSAIFCLMRRGALVPGIMFLIMAPLSLLWLYLARSRIPFSAVLLRISAQVAAAHKGLLVCNILLSIVMWVYVGVFWTGMAYPTFDRIVAGTSQPAEGAVFFIFLVILLWVGEVVPNIMHVTAAGVAATWYFAGPLRMPKRPAWLSFKRATTTSLGSICFGSLMVAIVRAIRFLAESAHNEDGSFLALVASCFLGCIESMLQYFNQYAFVHVAIYGGSYIESAKQTWALVKQCPFAALFNDCLIDPTLGFLTLGMSVIMGVGAGVILQSIPFGVIAFVEALIIHTLTFSIVSSAATTIFVCFAECPDGLRESSPDFYDAMVQADASGGFGAQVHQRSDAYIV